MPLGTKKTSWLCGFGLGLVWLFNRAYSGLVEGTTHHPIPVQETELWIASALKANPLVAVLAVVILGPGVEEILVRGLLYGVLDRRLPANGTIIVTALIFARYHTDLLRCDGRVHSPGCYQRRAIWTLMLSGSLSL